MPVVLSETLNSNASPTLMPLGWMGVFGQGLYKAFMSPGTHSFVVPEGVSRIRVRVVGAGGSGSNGSSNGGAGSSSSFGNLMSATGGGGGNSNVAFGGQGTGGDFQAKGGNAFRSGSNVTGYAPDVSSVIAQLVDGQGGAAAGSQLGDGGHSFGYGGAAVGGNHSIKGSSFGASAYGVPTISAPGPDCMGLYISQQSPDRANYPIERFPFDFFSGSGSAHISYSLGSNGGTLASVAGSGAGGMGYYNSNGGHGGGGGGHSNPSGSGGIGGGGGKIDTSGNYSGGAGGGYAHGEFDVVSGTEYSITVGAGGRYNSSTIYGAGGNGLVVVEW